MAKINTEVSRIYLENTSGHKKRLLNIVSIYKDERLFEYKITFEGFKIYGNWLFVESGVTDTQRGMLKHKRTKEVEGQLTIGYHYDGNIMYNVGHKNFRPVKHTSLSKVNKATLFLRVAGFSLEDLVPVKGGLKENATVHTLENYSNKTDMVCDLYISKGPTKLNFIADPIRYKNSESISLNDEEEKISIHFHFYRAGGKGVYIMIVRKDFWSSLKRYWLYYTLLFKERYLTGHN